MLKATFSASKRSLFSLIALAGFVALSLGLSGCAGVVSPSNGQGSPDPTGSLAISNVQAGGATNSSVQLSWATNQASTSAVDYGTTTAYGATTPVSSTMVMTHQMAVTGLAQGTTYHFRVRSTTGSDSASSPDQICTTTGGNNAPPSVQVTSPAAGATLSGKVSLTAVASDNGTVSGVQFQVDGKNVGADLTASPYLYVLDSSTLSNGAHSIDAVATDNSGKSTTSATVAVKVDNTTKDTTPPTVSITAPANGAKVTGVVAVTAIAADNVSVASVQFEIDGANVGATDVAAPYAYSWDTSKAANGAHTLKAVATDGSGNTTTSAGVTVTVNNTGADKTPPTVAISSPTAAATVAGTVNVTATAADNVGVASVQFQVDGVNAGGADGSTPYAFAWDTTKVANGAHQLDAIARDAAGNATTSAIVTVTVNNAAAKNFSISGTLSGAGGAGATVTLGGASVAATTTNNAGGYTFTGLAKGAYTVTPSHTGFTFSPAAQAETIANANVTGVNFAATAVAGQTFSISGTISGAGGSGATVALTGTSTATTTTNGAGAYTFAGLAKGAYTVTASHTGFTFTPPSLPESISTANVSGANFAATAVAPQTFSISGTISGTGGNGATVTLTGKSGATTTANAAGTYTFSGLAAGSYSVTPSHTGFTFNPGTLAETITTANITAVNFAATATAPQTFSISGTISGTGGNGATVTLTGKSLATTTASAAGAYSFTGLAAGSYSVTPIHTGFTFGPTSKAATIAAANVPGINFTSTAVAPQTFSISGTISGPGGSGATVNLTGLSIATVTANASGVYTFTGLATGAYVVTPSHKGFNLTPVSLAATIATANVAGINFNSAAVAAQTFSISGTLSGAGGSGATVTLSGTSGATTTASGAGAYTFTGLAKGVYTVTPSHTGFTFTPGPQAETITAANITGVNFSSAAVPPQTFSISGTITGTGGSGSTVTLSGASVAATTANAAGAFTFTGLAKGSYTVTPSHTGFTFSPGSQVEAIATANISGLTFAATAVAPTTFSISGTISGTGGSGTILTLSGPSSATATANASGAYTFSGLAKGTYAITPSHTGFTFSPNSQSAAISTANVTAVNFTSTAAPTTFSISGTITPSSGGSGATVILSGTAGATTTTNASGAYTFTGLANGAYSVTPSNSGFAFTPASTNVTIGGANKTGVNFTAASNKPHSVTLNWAASTSKVSGYNVYRSTLSGSGYVKLNGALIAGTTYTDTTVQGATTYFYVTTSVDSSNTESAQSNQATVTIP
jgi:Bacterial Ig domain/Carboxypeptidase regulatory-like domain